MGKVVSPVRSYIYNFCCFHASDISGAGFCGIFQMQAENSPVRMHLQDLSLPLRRNDLCEVGAYMPRGGTPLAKSI
jgi:hypothetical protein